MWGNFQNYSRDWTRHLQTTERSPSPCPAAAMNVFASEFCPIIARMKSRYLNFRLITVFRALSLLFSKGKITMTTQSEDTPFEASPSLFFYSAKTGNLDTLKECVQQDESYLTKKDELGNTALHWAASAGHLGKFSLDIWALTTDERTGNWKDGKFHKPFIEENVWMILGV